MLLSLSCEAVEAVGSWSIRCGVGVTRVLVGSMVGMGGVFRIGPVWEIVNGLLIGVRWVVCMLWLWLV